MDRPVLNDETVHPYRNPHKVYLLVVFTLGGVLALMLPHNFADSVSSTLPPWAYTAWALGLTGGAGLALVGAMQGGGHGLNAERLGLTMLTAVCIVWSVAILVIFPDKGIGTVIFYGGFAAANIARIRHINEDLERIREEFHHE